MTWHLCLMPCWTFSPSIRRAKQFCLRGLSLQCPHADSNHRNLLPVYHVSMRSLWVGKIYLLLHGRGKERVILCSILSWYPFPSVSSFPSFFLFFCLVIFFIAFFWVFFSFIFLHLYLNYLFLALYLICIFLTCSVLNMFLSYYTPCHTCPFWPPLYLAGPLLNPKVCLLCWERVHLFF